MATNASRILNKVSNWIKSLYAPYANMSFSQEGEDLILKRIIGEQIDGFYIDIGAHHPKRFSNTYLFYKAGWQGLNIDALPGSKKIFDRMRPKDINLEIGVSNQKGKLDYYMFNEPALNTFDFQLAKEYLNNSHFILLGKKSIETDQLSSILSKYLHRQEIDFMSIDVEGYEMQVLKSNNWNKYRPKYLLIELLNADLDNLFQVEAHCFLLNVKYKLVAKTVNTFFYMDMNLLETK